LIKLPKFPYSSRLKRLQEVLSARGISKALILKPENIYYLSLFQAVMYARPIAMIVPKEGDPVLVVPYLDLEHAKERSPVPEVEYYYREEELYGILKEELGGVRRLGLDVDSLRMYAKVRELSEGSEILPISEEIEGMRMIKDEAEVLRIKLAAEVTDFGMMEVAEALRKRQSEIAVAARGEYAMKMRLADLLGEDGLYPWSSWTVVAALSGPRSFYPHGMVSARKVRDGDVVRVLLGVAVEGYRVEHERTFVIGKPSPEVEKYFSIVEKAQRVAIESLGPGRLAEEADKSAMKVFSSTNTLQYVKHRTGHGIGLEIHERPYLAEGDRTVLREGMVVCVEPGIYVPGLGGFIFSDPALITGSGREVLTKTPKSLAVLQL